MVKKKFLWCVAFFMFFSAMAGAQTKSFMMYNQVRYNKTPGNLLPYLLPLKIGNENLLLNASDSMPNQAAIESFAATCPAGVPVTLDLETWPYYPSAALTKTISRFQTAITYFKNANTTSPIGFYGVPPKQAYQWSSIDPVNNPGGYASWKSISDNLAPVAKNVDNFQPSFYTYDGDTTSWRKMVDTTIAALKRYSTTKPIYAYIWPQYHTNTDSALRFIDTARWKYELRTLYDRTDGVIIWTSNKDTNNNIIYWDPNMVWWQATKSFMVEKALASPFEIDSFSVKRSGNTESLYWRTSIDTSTKKFLVQRSTDGINYQSVSDSITPVANHYTENAYQYTDNSTETNLYYRLMMVNKDAGIQYSSVLVLNGNDVSADKWANPGSTWTYGFTSGATATLTATGISSSTDASPFLPTPPTGVTHAFIGSGSGASFSLNTANNNLTLVGGNSGSAKFSAYNIDNATQVANASFDITFDSTGSVANNTAFVWSIGNSNQASTLYSNSNAVYTANNSGNVLFTALRWLYSTTKGAYLLSYRQGSNGSAQNYVTLVGGNFYPGVKYTFNIFCNNAFSAQSYNFNGASYTLAAQGLQVWATNNATGTATRYKISSAVYDLPVAVETNSTTGDKSIAPDAVLNAFLFQGSANVGNTANIIIDGGMRVAYLDESVVPVSFVSNSFMAQLINKSVQLNWSTASEQNNAYFEVLHSADGNTFSAIGKVVGHQTTSIQHNYSFTDNNPYCGINYYKLKLVDVDGQITYNSNILAINGVQQQQNILTAYVSGNQLNATIHSANIDNAILQVFSVSGEQLLYKNVQLNPGENHISLNISPLPQGVSILAVNTKGQQHSVKFIK